MSTAACDQDLDLLTSHLIDMDWLHTCCVSCGREIWTQRVQSCCEQILQGHRAAMPSIEEAIARVREVFRRRDILEHPPMKLRAESGLSDMINTGGRINNAHIFFNAASLDLTFVLQPVVRLQYREEDQGTGGTSFINLCLEQSGPTLAMADFIRNFEICLDVVSDLGVYVPNLILILEAGSENYGSGPFNQITVSLRMNGIEFGNLNWCPAIPRVGQSPTSVTDLSLGLERMIQATLSMPKYYTAVGPSTLIGDAHPDRLKWLDDLRLIALSIGCGIRISPSGPGSHLRAAIDRSLQYNTLPATTVFGYYYRQWESCAKMEIAYNDAERAYHTAFWSRLAHGQRLTTGPFRSLSEVEAANRRSS